jgi:hypothetical protein
MADVTEQRIFCAEQIVIPNELQLLLKNYSKAIIRNNPKDLISFSKDYFQTLIENREEPQVKENHSNTMLPKQ